jgi:sigma-B regulation protein RsbU (phosphoserine phosphatase)
VAHDGASPRLAFTVGDVSGHGVAAAFLMARLASMFRTLVDLDAPLHDVVAKANALFTQSAPSPFFATLVAGRASADGTVNVCNAGHLSPLVMRGREVMEIESSGLPVGIAGAEQYATSTAMLRRGDTLVLYTDGVTEAQSGAGELYGAERLADVLRGNAAQPPRPLAAAVLRDVVAFRGDAAVDDDVTLMILRRSR